MALGDEDPETIAQSIFVDRRKLKVVSRPKRRGTTAGRSSSSWFSVDRRTNLERVYTI